MWMVGGYNEASHHQYHHHQVSLDGRKLRPLIPRPPPAAPSPAACASSATTHSCTAAAGGEQGISNKNIMMNNNNNFKEEVNNINGGQQAGVMSTSRWNPTAEQLRTLEDLYRRGTRTPSTDQIQRITAQLRRYGKIEGKNVFYWFQNHKARERQKRRRELQLLSSHHPHMHPHQADADADDPLFGIGSKETTRGPANGNHGFDAEHTRSHYASPAAEECGVMSMPRRAAEKAVSEHRSSSSRRSTPALNFNNVGSSAVASLFQLDDERNATWHNLAPSSSFCYSSPYSLLTRITTTSTLPTCTDSAPDGATFKTRRFVASLRAPVPETTSRGGEDGEDSATLQLFPLRSQVHGQQEEEEDPDKSNRGDVHFFQFLPPKNN